MFAVHKFGEDLNDHYNGITANATTVTLYKINHL